MSNLSARSKSQRKRDSSTAAVFALAIFFMAMVSSTMDLVAASPIHEDTKGSGENDSSAASLDDNIIETLVSNGAGSIRASVASSPRSLSPKLTNDCVDEPEFFYEGKKACEWVGKAKRKKRCKILYQDLPLAERCRETCDYNDCKTILEQKELLLVGAYYYPWWGNDFHGPHSYLRRQLTGPQQFPAILEYDDTLKEVITQHLKWSREANIKLWATSWWGPGRRTDITTKDHILTHPQLKEHKIAAFYETTGRIREKEDYDLKNVIPDLEYLCTEYFNHPNYYQKVDHSDGSKRPVLFVYLTRKLENLGLLEKVVSLMREGAKNAGCNDIFIIGDQVFQGPPSENNDEKLIPFEILDAVTTYDSYGSMRGRDLDGYIGSKEKIQEYYQGEQKAWKNIALSKGCAFVSSASPGFNDRGVRPELKRIPLSRRISKESPEGSFFEAALREARTLVDLAADNLIMINSFNEWHEDTQIEPCISFNGSKKKNSQTAFPGNLTHSLKYEAYGDSYLRILNEETKKWKVSLTDSTSESAEAFVSNDDTKAPSNDGGSSSNGTYSDEEEDFMTISDFFGMELELD